MAKRGPKPKVQEVVGEAKTEISENIVVKQGQVDMKPNTSITSGLISDEARDEIYDQYEQYRIQHSTEPPVPEVISEPQPEIVEPVVEQPEEVPPVEEPQIQEKEPEQYVKEPQKEEKLEKTVPLAALHEARTENKDLKRKLQEFERKLQELESKTVKPEETAYEDFEFATKQEVNTLKEEIEKRKQLEAKLELENKIEFADKQLKSEKIYGFKELGKLVVTEKLREMFNVDPEWCKAHDNPEGWIEIWRKEHGKYKQLFVEEHKSSIMAEKEQRKQDSGMVTSPGAKSIPATPPKATLTREEEYAEYMRERRSRML